MGSGPSNMVPILSRFACSVVHYSTNEPQTRTVPQPPEACRGRTRVRRGRTLVPRSRALVCRGRALVGRGRALVGRGRTLVPRSRALVGRGRALVPPSGVGSRSAR